MAKKSTSTATVSATIAAAVTADTAPADSATPADRIATAVDQVLTAGEPGRFVLHLRSSRAPYRRGGVKFGSTRETVTVREGDMQEPDLRAIMGDGAIVVTLGDLATGRTVEIPAELRVRAAGGDPEADAQLAELAASLTDQEDKKD